MKTALIPAAACALALTGAYTLYCWFPHREKPARRKRRVLCVGDSITFGAGVVYTRWRDSYPAILSRLLGNRVQVLNYGISGATAQAGTDSPYRAAFRAAAAKTEPELCVLMLGTNDSKPHNWNGERYEKAVRAWVVEMKRYLTRPRIILAVPPKAFSVKGKPIVYAIRDEVIRDEIRPILYRLAQSEGVEMVDFYEATKEHPEYFADGVHPNAAGNLEIAHVLYQHIISTSEDRSREEAR